MPAPPPGADVQDGNQPTAAGLAVTEGSLTAPFLLSWGNPWFHGPPPCALRMVTGSWPPGRQSRPPAATRAAQIGVREP
jgi:hypothetical protein